MESGLSCVGVLKAILKRILWLRAKFRVDVKSALRKVGGNPDDASRFAYRLGPFLFVDFGLRGSPGWWGASGESDPGGPEDSLVAVAVTAGVSIAQGPGTRWPIYRLNVRFRQQRVRGRRTQHGPHFPWMISLWSSNVLRMKDVAWPRQGH